MVAGLASKFFVQRIVPESDIPFLSHQKRTEDHTFGQVSCHAKGG
jgi:hypothetical protein